MLIERMRKISGEGVRKKVMMPYNVYFVNRARMDDTLMKDGFNGNERKYVVTMSGVGGFRMLEEDERVLEKK